MSGGPSQHDLWDYKPKLRELAGKQLPKHIRDGQRVTGMTARQKNGFRPEVSFGTHFFQDLVEAGIKRIAELAWQVNEGTENIGARRLHTVMERLLETLSFEASDMEKAHIIVDEDYVNSHLQDLASDTDLSRFIL